MYKLTKDNSDLIPDENMLAEAASAEILDEQGNTVRFGSLFEQEKTIVVFIRHFFCGVGAFLPKIGILDILNSKLMCQSYMSQLGQVPQPDLDAAAVQVVAIGCGDWQLISNYKKNSNFLGAVFTDPKRALFKTLGMTLENLEVTPSNVQKRSYAGGIAYTTFLSIIKIRNPLHFGKQGNLSQLGGDFILGPGPTCAFAHRMLHTQDHVEVEELLKQVGISFKPS